MRIAIFFLLLSITFCNANNSFSQESKFTFNIKTTSIKEICRELEQKSDYRFVFSGEAQKIIEQKTDLVVQEESIEKILTTILSGTHLKYQIVNNQVVVFKDESAKNVSDAAAVQQKQKTISGKVVDKQGEPIIGANILEVGTTSNGTVTDIDGNFSLTVKNNSSIRITYLGYVEQNIPIGNDNTYRVVMTEDSKALEEVIITGYQQIEKRQSTSAVSSIKTEDLNVIGSTSVENMLQGQLAGLSIVNTSASPGTAPKVRVRGTATISGNTEPLWVLDGVMLETSVPITAEELNSPDFMNTFNSVIGGISPNDIESITVLKDASATAIYGTRAANGVIVVTTKKGKRNSFNISYRHTSAVDMRPSYKDFDLLNSQERVELTQQMYNDGLRISGTVGMENLMTDYAHGKLSREEYINKVHDMETRNTDWFKLLYRNAYSQTHNLSISGGADNMDYYVSLNYDDKQGSDKISNFKNFGGMAKVNAELFKGVKLGTTLQAGRRDRETYFASTNPFKYAVRTSRTIPAFDEDGNYFFYKSTDLYGYYLFNIFNEQENTSNKNTQTDLKSIINLSVNLLPGIKYSGLYSYSTSFSSAMTYAKERSSYVASIRKYDFGQGIETQIEESELPYGGIYNESTYESRTSLLRNSLEYKGLLSNDFSMDAIIGQEFRTTDYRGLSSSAYGYMHDRGNIFYNPPNIESTGHLKRNTLGRNIPKRSYVSYYGVLSGMYKERYVINGNIRFDGSNLFGSNPKYRYLPLWSMSGKWIMSNEDFLSESKLITNLALRASYGLRGNIVEESTPQIIASALPPNPSTGLLEMRVIQAPNPNLKWETTSSLNLGLEVGLFNNRLAFDVDYFRDYSTDLIAYKEVSSVTGFQSKSVNYADVRNQGVDVSVTGQIIRTGKFSWSTAVNLGYVKNEVVKSNIRPQALNMVRSVYVPGEVYVGKPVNAMFSYRFAELDEEGMPLFFDKDDNKIGHKNPNIGELIYNNLENLKYEGTRDPIINGGWNNTFRYKDFTLSFLFSFGLKNVVRLPDFAYSSAPASDQNANRHIMDRWREPGDEATKIIPRLSGGSSSFSTEYGWYYATDLFNRSQVTVVPGDYLRMKNLMVEYRLPAKLGEKLVVGGKKLAGASISFQVQNLFVIADKRLRGYDPETINYTTTGYGSLPLQTSYTLGLNINF